METTVGARPFDFAVTGHADFVLYAQNLSRLAPGRASATFCSLWWNKGGDTERDQAAGFPARERAGIFSRPMPGEAFCYWFCGPLWAPGLARPSLGASMGANAPLVGVRLWGSCCPRRSVTQGRAAPTPFRSPFPLFQQRRRLLQVGGVETLAETTVHAGQDAARILGSALLAPNAAEAHGSPQFQRSRALGTRDIERSH
jgi:hypothetical protein